MAERLMAEATTGSGFEGGTGQAPQAKPSAPLKYTTEQLSQIPVASRASFLQALPEHAQPEAVRVFGLEMRGGAGPTWMTELEEAKNQKSEFQETCDLYETLIKANRHRDKIPANRRAEFDQLFVDTQKKMRDLIASALASPVLAFAEDDIRGVYTEAIQVPQQIDTDSYSYSSPPTSKTKDEHLSDVQNALGRDEETGAYHYKETFWEYDESTLKAKFEERLGSNVDLQELRSKYEGVASYIAAKVAIAIEKEFKRIHLDPNGPGFEKVGDAYLDYIQNEVRRRSEVDAQNRQRERRRARFKERLRYNHWRERFDFAWAENADELNESVLDWLEFFQQQLPQEAAEKVNESVQTGRRNALSALEAALHRLEIPVRSQTAKELRATIEGHVDVIGGVQLLESPGGFEPYTAYLEDFSNNFNAHHDAVYLRNPKAAIIHDFLSNNDGEICLGGPDTTEKPLDGETKAFRADLEEKAKIYAATHELYIRKEDFDSAELGRDEIIREIQQMNLPTEEANALFQERLAERMGRYGWYDEIEELLLIDQRHRDQAATITDPVEQARVIARINARTEVFKKIKARCDEEDGFTGLSPDERKDAVRERIEDQMSQFGNTTLTARIKAMPDGAEKDRELWRWVKNYNSLREKNGLEGWFPTSWDMVRLSIDTPTKLIDRVLSKTEFGAMVEEINDPYAGLTEEQTREQMLDEFREGFRSQLAGLNLTPKEEEERIDQEIAKRENAIRIRIEDVVFDREKRRAEAERAFTVGRAYQKFLGLDARWGGLTTRVVTQNGETKLRTISSLARDILKAKIDKEEREIKDKVTQFALTLPNNLTQKQKEAAMTKKRRLFRRDATFAATLGLREIGIASDLPIWNYHYYGDVSQIQAFAPLVGYTHNDKGYLPELLDRGRREMEAVYSFLADQYMDKNGGEILIIQDDPIVDQHEESWERARVISEGGELALRDLFESRFMVSTSGGVKVPDLIAKIGDLGVYDLLWENGCQDLREFQGFIKRRDEVELREQSFWNTRKWADPIKYAQRLRGAGAAKTMLVGGEVKGQGWVPGVFNEPYNGLWRFRDEFLAAAKWMSANIKKIISGERKLPKKGADLDKVIRGEVNLDDTPILSKLEDMKEYRAQVVELLNKQGISAYLSPVAKDTLIRTGGEILKFLLDYMNSRRYLTNRAGYAPKNWQYDNELIAQALFGLAIIKKPVVVQPGEMKENGEIAIAKEQISDTGGEVLGGDHLAYAPEGTTDTANVLFMGILRASSYHILDEADRRVFYGKADATKKEMDKMRDTLANQPLPIAVQDMITNRINKLKAQGMGTRVDSFKARGLVNPAVVDSLVEVDEKTRDEWKSKGAKDEEITSLLNLNKERERLKKHYIEERLHMEFVGEWAARLAA